MLLFWAVKDYKSCYFGRLRTTKHISIAATPSTHLHLSHLKLINLLLLIPQLLQYPAQLSLVLRTLLSATYSFIHARRPADEDLAISVLGFEGEHGFEELFCDVAGPLLPVSGRLVEEVEGAEAVGVGVFEVFEFALEEDVFFGLE